MRDIGVWYSSFIEGHSEDIIFGDGFQGRIVQVDDTHYKCMLWESSTIEPQIYIITGDALDAKASVEFNRLTKLGAWEEARKSCQTRILNLTFNTTSPTTPL